MVFHASIAGSACILMILSKCWIGGLFGEDLLPMAEQTLAYHVVVLTI